MAIKNSPVINGRMEVEVDTWSDLMEFINMGLLNFKYVYRGQRKEQWALETSLDRELRRNGNNSNAKDLVEYHLTRFKYASRGRKGGAYQGLSSSDPENDWWALAQHNGMCTPLLDWSESPYVAIFFAFAKETDEPTSKRACWAIMPYNIEASERIKGMIGKIEFLRPIRDDNPRLVSQSGLFTKSPYVTTIDGWIKTAFFGDSGPATLIKITMPESIRSMALKSLNRMNINYSTLFPDLYGASMHANMYLSVPEY